MSSLAATRQSKLIVASNDVAASTAQLVAASRVKASLMSKTQERLETASRAVTGACRHLVRQVQEIIAQRNRDEGDGVDYASLTTHELKTQEMEQQVSPSVAGYFRSRKPSSADILAGRNSKARKLAGPGQDAARRDEEAVVPGGVIFPTLNTHLCRVKFVNWILVTNFPQRVNKEGIDSLQCVHGCEKVGPLNKATDSREELLLREASLRRGSAVFLSGRNL